MGTFGPGSESGIISLQHIIGFTEGKSNDDSWGHEAKVCCLFTAVCATHVAVYTAYTPRGTRSAASSLRCVPHMFLPLHCVVCPTCFCLHCMHPKGHQVYIFNPMRHIDRHGAPSRHVMCY